MRFCDNDNLPVVVDLCCGDCGFTDAALECGARVLAVDLRRFPRMLELRESPYVRFFVEDVRQVSGYRFRWLNPILCFAGPPCDEFARFKMPWTRKRNPPPPDLSIVNACFRIAREADCPIVLENTQTAQKWLGPAVGHFGPHYLWGDVPAMLPDKSWNDKRHKESFSSAHAHKRALLPRELGRFLVESFKRRNECSLFSK